MAARKRDRSASLLGTFEDFGDPASWSSRRAEGRYVWTRPTEFAGSSGAVSSRRTTQPAAQQRGEMVADQTESVARKDAASRPVSAAAAGIVASSKSAPIPAARMLGKGTVSVLQSKFLKKLQGSEFRWINEMLYTKHSGHAKETFAKEPSLFFAYHDGFVQQTGGWKFNPLDRIIAHLKQLRKSAVVADFGAGTGRLAKEVPQGSVHSFDLVSAAPHVVACDMAHVPMQAECVDVAVFCLSLMGTNLSDFLLEANRVLRVGGLLKIAEVASRFSSVAAFVQGVESHGFRLKSKDTSDSFFFFFDFDKMADAVDPRARRPVVLQPCIYKKR